jgi:hypothetical protein
MSTKKTKPHEPAYAQEPWCAEPRKNDDHQSVVSWRVGRRNDLPQTSYEAAVEHTRALRDLSTVASTRVEYAQAASRLARKLARCSANRHCGSLACPLCRRAQQRWFVAAMWEHVIVATSPYCIVTIVPGIRLNIGDIDIRPKLSRLWRRLGRTFDEAGIRDVVAVLDISANEHHDDAFRPHYCLHVWCLIPRQQAVAARTFLGRAFPPTPTISRPVLAQSFNGDPRAFAYAMKPTFYRRVTYPRVLDADGSTRHRQFCKPRRLRVAQHGELMLMLDQLQLSDRFLLRGARFEGDGIVSTSACARGRPSHQGEFKTSNAQPGTCVLC